MSKEQTKITEIKEKLNRRCLDERKRKSLEQDLKNLKEGLKSKMEKKK